MEYCVPFARILYLFRGTFYGNRKHYMYIHILLFNLLFFRLVPALNVIANHFKIPPDIAGATLMAAGASSPELFSSFVALFVTHSALGLGTVVGSEIFNQLIICAGAVFASKTGKLILDRTILAREVGFYALAIILLFLALQDSRPLEDDPDGPSYIYISFYQATMVFSGYILYVIVCSNFEAITSCMTTAKKSVDKRLTSYNNRPNYGAAVSTKVRVIVNNLSVVPGSHLFWCEYRTHHNHVAFRILIKARWII